MDACGLAVVDLQAGLYIMDGGYAVFIKLVLRRTRLNGGNTDVPEDTIFGLASLVAQRVERKRDSSSGLSLLSGQPAYIVHTHTVTH